MEREEVSAIYISSILRVSLKLLKIQSFVQIFDEVSRDALLSTALNVTVKTVFNR